MRIIDHLVMPVEGLPQARAALRRLGFTVATDARHPFGTENACVFLEDGAYLEPLAIGDPDAYAGSADAGNVFTGRDRQVRRIFPQGGLSAVVLATDDAFAEDAAYCATGLSAGEILEFSRKLELPAGGEVTASFRLAFAADDASPAFFMFSCERINVLPREIGALAQHANGVSGLREVVLSAGRLAEGCHLLETILATEGRREGNSVMYGTHTGIVRVIEGSRSTGPATAKQGGTQDLRGHSVVFSVTDLAVTASVLAANDVPFLRQDDRLVVANATGQDVLFAFEE